MPVPSPRSKLLPARGNYSDLAANVAELLDGEICYAIDQDQYYQKEGSVLVSVGATKAQGLLADSALQDAPSDGSEYVRKNGTWAVSTGGGAGATTIDGLSDVDTSSVAPTDGQALVWSAADSEWQPGTVSGGGGGASSLDDLSDVDLTVAPSNGQVLVYDSAESTFKPSAVAVDGAGQPVITYVINASGTSAYTFAGPGFTAPTGNPELYVVRGQTYVFSNQSGAHPFQIQSTQGSGGTAYSDGVTGNNTIGDVILTVPYDAPGTLYYQCTAHAAMNGTINVATVSAGGGGGATSLDELSDVDTSTTAPSDGDALTWSDIDNAWIPLGGSGATTYGPFIPQNFHTFDSTDTASDASSDLQDWDGPVSTDEFVVGTGACDGRPTNSGCEVAGQFADTGILTGDPFSINFWFYHDNVTEGTGTNIIGCTKSSNDLNTPSGLLIRVLSSTFNLPTELSNKGVQYQSMVLMNDDNSGAIIGTKFPVMDSVWRHYSFTHNGSGVYRLWVDGILHDTVDNGSPVDFSSAGGLSGLFEGEFVVMGSYNDSSRNYGVLDNFAVYNADVFDGVTEAIPQSALLEPVNQPFVYSITPPIGATTNLSDFSPSIAADGQVPLYVDTESAYVPSTLSLANISDVDTTSNTPLDGQLLSYNDSNSTWEPTSPGSGTEGPAPKSPNASQNFEAYGTGDFSDWADGLSSTDSRIGSSHCDYSGAAGGGCTDSWFVDTDALWMEFWFKHDETAPGDQIIWGVASPNAPSPQVGDSGFHCKLTFDAFQLPEDTPHATALTVMKGTNNSSDSILQTINTNPADGQWHHYAIYLQPQSEANGGSYFSNDGLMTLYVDGRIEDTYDNGGEFNMRPVGAYFGDTLTLLANTDGTKPCRGQMDNFRAFTANSIPVPRQVEAFTPNEDDADTPIAYDFPKQVDSTLNLTDFSQVPAAEGQSPIYRNGKYTPANHLNVVKFITSFDDNFGLPQSSDDDFSVRLGFPQEPGMCIVDTVGGSMWIWTGPYDVFDEVGGWVTVDLFSGGGPPA